MRIALYFYDVPKKGSTKVKFFRDFYGYKKVNKKYKGLLQDNNIAYVKPGDGAIMVDYRYYRTVNDFFKANNITNKMFTVNVDTRWFNDNKRG